MARIRLSTLDLEYFHLLYCDLVQFFEAFALRESVVYQHRVDVLEVRQADELVYLGVVAHVALQVGTDKLTSQRYSKVLVRRCNF